MKRIYISNDVQNLAEQYRDNLFTGRGRGFQYPKRLLDILHEQIRSVKYKKYVKKH